MCAEVQTLASARLKAICEGTAATFGGTANVIMHPGYPVMVNSEEQTRFAAEVARKVSGECDENAALGMGAEDFAYMLEVRPGA